MKMKKIMMMGLLLSTSSWTIASKPIELLKGYNRVHSPNTSAQQTVQTVNNAVQATQNATTSIKNNAQTAKNAINAAKNTAKNTVQNTTQVATTQTNNTVSNATSTAMDNSTFLMNQEALKKLEEMAKKTAILEKQLEETQIKNNTLQQQLAEISKANNTPSPIVAAVTQVAPTTPITHTTSMAQAPNPTQAVEQIKKNVDKKVSEANKKISNAAKKAQDDAKKAQATAVANTTKYINSLTPEQRIDYLKQMQQTYSNLLTTQNQDISDITRLQQQLLRAQKKMEEAKLQVDKLSAELMLSQEIQATQYRKLQQMGEHLGVAWKAVYGENSKPNNLVNTTNNNKI